MIAKSLPQLQKELVEGRTTLPEVVQSYLDNITNTKDLNIYVNVYDHEARQKALELQEKINESPDKLGKLFGAVISIKDVICYKDHPVTASSKILEGFESLFDATIVKKLLAEDAIIIGSTNCDEFAMGSSNEHSHYGPTLNSDNPAYIPGGSSGGAAVSVQADTCLAAIGSDTGGSVRQPAAFCGVIGMKPTYGRISRYGLIAYASSFDQIGIIGKETVDVATILEVISGPDEYDSTVSNRAVPKYSQLSEPPRGFKIGVLSSLFEHQGMNQDIRKISLEFISGLKGHNYNLIDLEFKNLDHLVPAYYVLTTAEASTNLSRYDGIKYGHRSDNNSDLQTLYTSSRTEGFGLEVKRRIMLGTFVLSSGYYDAYFEKAQKIRKLIKNEIEALFEKVDVIILPISMDYPWKIGEKDLDPVSVYLSDVFTVIANLCGIPGLSLPIGKGQNNLSIGIQLLSKRFNEQDLLNLSANLQKMA